MSIGEYPNARTTGEYSPLVSPAINVLTPNSIIRRKNATIVEDLPVPGSPKKIRLGLLTIFSASITHSMGEQ